MRGRVGGRIGTTVLPYPAYSYSGYSSQGSAKGVWGMAEVYAASRGYLGGGYDYYGGSTWPTSTLSVTWPNAGYWGGYATLDYIDATQDGSGTFSPTVDTNYASVSYSWERSTDGGTTWTSVSGETDPTLALTGQTTANDEDKYRLIADAGLKVVRSDPGTVRVDSPAPSIGYHPQSQTVAEGDYVYLEVYASCTGPKYGGYYTPTLQWQVSTDGGTTWTNQGSAMQTTEAYQYFSATASDNGKKYRVVATFGSQSVTSNVATITVT